MKFEERFEILRIIWDIVLKVYTTSVICLLRLLELNWSQYDKLMTLTGCEAIGRGLSHSESDRRQQEVDLWSILLL